ncbi:MAG: LEPR-XLL domain-containing protein [SAR324 cluster bacterium]|nr:LEPR-XLL domain-containing protein [SAR324 cluster bacterium]
MRFLLSADTLVQPLEPE